MRSLNQLLLIAIVLVSVAGVAVAQDKPDSLLTVKFDAKKNMTTVRLKSMKLSPVIVQDQSASQIPLHQVQLDISTSFEGEKPTKPVDVQLRFYVTSGKYIFLTPQAAMAVLDKEGDKGRAFALGTSDYKSLPSKFNSIFEEVLVITTPAEAIMKMADAKTLHLYLGPVPYPVVGKGQLDAIKELAEFLKTAAPAKGN